MDADSAAAVLLTPDELMQILSQMPAGYVKPSDELDSPPIMPAYKKLGVLVDMDEVSTCERIDDSVSLYNCNECKRSLPTAHLLDLHIMEQHDTYFAASVERANKPMYGCYLEECLSKFNTPKERKNHCISAHKFPTNYRFDQCQPKAKASQGANNVDMDIDETSNLSASDNNQMPYIKAFSFGHHPQRTFKTRRERHECGKTLEDVQSMKDALNDITDTNLS